jgi:serine/threonine protein kinase
MVVEALSWVGKTVAGGRYRVTALLGEGGMGAVYRTHDANLDAEVRAFRKKLDGFEARLLRLKERDIVALFGRAHPKPAKRFALPLAQSRMRRAQAHPCGKVTR